jgi:hypothetical protein
LAAENDENVVSQRIKESSVQGDSCTLGAVSETTPFLQAHTDYLQTGNVSPLVDLAIQYNGLWLLAMAALRKSREVELTLPRGMITTMLPMVTAGQDKSLHLIIYMLQQGVNVGGLLP